MFSPWCLNIISLYLLYSQHQQHRHTSSSPQSTSPHTAAARPSHNQLYYVTERILAALLPSKASSQVNNLFEYDENGNRSGDKFETDLLHMLEQKHGTKFRLFDLESCIPSISLERLCELCKHIEAWLSSGHNTIVVLQDRWVPSARAREILDIFSVTLISHHVAH